MKRTLNQPFPANFQKVVDYLQEHHDVDVKLGGTTVFLGMGLNRIFVHYAHNLEKNGLYSLLHEAGHALQPRTNTGANYYKSIDEDKHPHKFTYHQFLNELDAWERGKKLAEKLGIDIDIKEYTKLKDESLITYFPK
jgi:hypothetical protein